MNRRAFFTAACASAALVTINVIEKTREQWHTFASGQTLTAKQLNDNFELLKKQRSVRNK